MKRGFRTSKTPIRYALATDSPLHSSIVDGIGAIDSAHRTLFDISVRTSVVDSLNLDDASKCGREQEHRWDYLVGHGPSGSIVAVEPHSAKDGAVAAVIKKRSAALCHLKAHLRANTRIGRWLWVSPGKVHFADTERIARHLEQNGIEFVGTRVTSRHLNVGPSAVPNRRRKG